MQHTKGCACTRWSHDWRASSLNSNMSYGNHALLWYLFPYTWRDYKAHLCRLLWKIALCMQASSSCDRCNRGCDSYANALQSDIVMVHISSDSDDLSLIRDLKDRRLSLEWQPECSVIRDLFTHKYEIPFDNPSGALLQGPDLRSRCLHRCILHIIHKWLLPS